MSVALSADDVTLADKRASFNPFDGCPWIEFFEELTWGYMTREDRGWSEPGPHHEQWFDDFERGDDLIRLAHRGSLKTTSTLAYTIACLEYKSGFHAAWIGNNETLAYEKAHSEFNKLVERNPWLTNLQEENRTTDQKGKKEFGHDSSLSVGWLFGGVEGVHVDLLNVDDVIKEKGDGDMQEIEDWLSSVIVPVQEHGGQTIVIGTRKTPTDIYSLLADREGFSFTEYPAVLDEWDAEFREDAPGRRPDPGLYHQSPHPLDPDRECQLLWDERGADYLADARSKQSEHAWMREFCLVVQTREGAVYDLFDSQKHVFSNDPDERDVQYWLNGLDWGSGHPAGMLVMARRSDGGVDVLDEAKDPVTGTSDYVDALSTFQAEFGPGTVGCDPSDKRGIDDLSEEGFDAVAADNDIEAGIRVVKDLFASGDLRIHTRCEELISELKAYRYNQTTGKPVKKNDHLVDGLRYGIMADEYPDEGGNSGSGTW
ncbi:hypothetical protein [Halorubrum trueperi]|uniref:Terminase large subunit gp17-like C-terminal domain-containing protein n=1 Tax=Halorubrum trueperi TaxID=2004704 RepID=A0ABD5UF71_9EURY